MKFSRRSLLHSAVMAAAVPALSPFALAGSYPSRSVRIIIGLPPGGGVDAVARIIANRLSQVWPQPVVVENRPGASQNLAAELVAHAAPDGYTILLATDLALNRLLFSSLAYDPAADFAPVTLIDKYPLVLAVPNSSPANSLQEFIARARANPGKITFASTGVGSLMHLTGELLAREAGIKLTHVPYRGVGAGALTDLIAGRIDSMINAAGSLIPPVRAGRIRGLAVTTAKRFASAPELPTFAESGVPGFDVAGGHALYVPAKTPPEVAKKIQTDTVTILAEPAVRARFKPLGIEVVGSTPEELAATSRAAVERWAPIIKALDIKLD
jgi:tripartite-type tricarboxylate transporter receptor subunit TctC